MSHVAVDPLLAHAVADFGRAVGLAGFALDDDGRARLQLAGGRLLTLAATETALRLQLELPLPFEGPELMERALVAAGARQRGGGVQLGLRGRGADQVLLMARWLGARRCSGMLLARELEILLDWFEQVRRAAPAGAGLPMGART